MGADFGGDPRKTSIYINVIPMIDMMIMLMIFQLSNFATSVFEDVAGLVAKMPVFDVADPTDEPPDSDPKALKDLRVRLTKADGFAIVVTTGEGTTQIDIPNTGEGDHDFTRLSDELLKIKQIYEQHDDAILEIERGIKYDNLVKAMDAVREKLVVSRDGQKMKYPLFPSISLTDTGTG